LRRPKVFERRGEARRARMTPPRMKVAIVVATLVSKGVAKGVAKRSMKTNLRKTTNFT